MGKLVTYFKGTPGPSGFGSASTAMDVTEGLSLDSHTAIVTGATAGIGKETARALAKRGARVVLATIDLRLGEEVKAEFLEENTKARVEVIQVDLSNLSSVRKFAAEFKARNLPLNILVNNAGISSMKEHQSTPEGLELMFATNSLGHFLLTDLLLDTMKTTATQTGIQGRIVVVSGALYTCTYEGGIAFDKLINSKEIYGFRGYGQQSLPTSFIVRSSHDVSSIMAPDSRWHHWSVMSLLLVSTGQEEGTKNIAVNTLHPGAIRTKLTQLDGLVGYIESRLPNFLFKTAQQGAATQTYLAVHPNVEGVSGKYFIDCNETPLSGHALDVKLADRLRKWSEDYISTH